MKLRDAISNKSGRELANIKADFIAEALPAGTFSRQGFTVEIEGVEKIEGGVQVYARAWKDGKPVGFSKDGTVEIERFRFFNPPVLVPDGTKETRTNSRGETWEVDRMKEDPAEALRQSLAHTIAVLKKGNGPIVKGKRGNTTSTFFPLVDGNLGSGESSWNTSHDAATAGYEDTADFNSRGYVSGGNYNIDRGHVVFDTAATIPDTDTVSAATLSLYGAVVYDQDNDGNDWVNIVPFTPANPANPALADFDQYGAIDNPTEYSTRKDCTSGVSTSAYNDFVLNASGLAAVSATTYSCFGVREGHDAVDNPYSAGLYTGVKWRHSSTSGTTQDPKLVVEHAAGSSTETDEHTVDALLADRTTASHTLDTLLKKAVTLAHTVSALLLRRTSSSHTADALLLKRAQLSHTSDALLKQQATATHTADALKKKALSVAHTLGSLLKKAGAASHSISALLKRRIIATHTTNALIVSRETTSHTVSSLKRKTITSNHSVSSYITRELARPYCPTPSPFTPMTSPYAQSDTPYTRPPSAC